MSERTLSARKLQQPLDKHLCKAAVYPAVDKDWRLSTLGPITGRGPTFASAVEALCREADGLSAQAAVALLWREPRGWSTTYEVRATAVRFAADFTLPPSPAPQDLRPPPASDPNVEPPPVGDVGTR